MFTTTAFAGGGDEEGEVIPTEPTGEVVSTPDPKPLTPEGNLSLVDDIDGEASEDKQFITVVSKTGNYFYIIIDRAGDGENTVHFLNQVDEADLLALMEVEEEPPAVCSCRARQSAGILTSCLSLFPIAQFSSTVTITFIIVSIPKNLQHIHLDRFGCQKPK